MAYVNYKDKGYDWIEVNGEGFTSVSSYVNFYCAATNETLSTSTWHNDSYGIYTGRVRFTGLKAGTTYTITGRVYWNGGDTALTPISITTLARQPEKNPYTFTWYDYELYALNNKGSTNTITWGRWNELCTQVKKTVNWYYGSDPYNCDNALMNGNSKTLTAYRFRVLRNAIGSMNPTGLDDNMIDTGRTVYGWYLTRLTDRLNSITKTPTYSIGTMEQLYNIDALMISAKIEDINKEVKNGDK